MSIFSSNKETPPTPQINNIPPRMEPVVASSILPTYGNSSSSSSPLTIISEGTMLEGQIKIEGDIKIEGNIKGSVTSKGKVIISNNGKVDGDIIKSDRVWLNTTPAFVLNCGNPCCVEKFNPNCDLSLQVTTVDILDKTNVERSAESSHNPKLGI